MHRAPAHLLVWGLLSAPAVPALAASPFDGVAPDFADPGIRAIVVAVLWLVAAGAIGCLFALLRRRRPDAQVAFRQRLESAVQASFEQLFAENSAGVLVLDENGDILVANPAATRLLGVPRERLVGAPFGIPIGGDVRTELDIVEAQGACGVAELIVSESLWLGKKAYLALLFDISERKAAEARMRRMAFADPLTQLPNRSLFLNRLEHTLRMAKRQRAGFAVIFMDIDRFKEINDNFGHAFGDVLLRSVARRLRQTLRDSDTVARIGGDEFTLIVYGIGNRDAAAIVADKIRSSMLAPFLLDDDELYITVSFGVALYPLHSEDSDELMRYADTAMYAAKRTRTGAFSIYGEAADVLAQPRPAHRTDCRDA